MNSEVKEKSLLTSKIANRYSYIVIQKKYNHKIEPEKVSWYALRHSKRDKPLIREVRSIHRMFFNINFLTICPSSSN